MENAAAALWETQPSTIMIQGFSLNSTGFCNLWHLVYLLGENNERQFYLFLNFSFFEEEPKCLLAEVAPYCSNLNSNKVQLFKPGLILHYYQRMEYLQV